MKNSLLLGLWKLLVRIPRPVWHREIARGATSSQDRTSFMSEDHHKVRDFVVLELPYRAAPIPPGEISARLNLTLPRTQEILDELEKGMTFLFRNGIGEVAWAYPVTAEPTPHRIRFNTGEQIYAAWAIDAIATPFVQGQLRKEKISCLIDTACALCSQPIHIDIDSELHYQVLDSNAQPLVFVPRVDFDRLEDPSIIDAF